MLFLVVWALYTLRHAYAKLTRASAERKVACAVVFCLGLLTRVVTRGLFCQQIWRSQLWSNFCLNLLLLFPCILAFCSFISLSFCTFCGFISFHFGLLCLPQKSLVCVAKGSTAASFIPPKTWGGYLYGWGYQVLTQGLRGGYAALTRGELVASDKRRPNPADSPILDVWHDMYSYLFLYISTVTMIKSAYASCLRNDISSTDTR